MTYYRYTLEGEWVADPATPPDCEPGIKTYVPGSPFGIEELRRSVKFFDNCDEGFLDGWSSHQLLNIWRSYQKSEWSFSPDSWTARQVEEAVDGIPPEWDENEQPVYRFQGKT